MRLGDTIFRSAVYEIQHAENLPEVLHIWVKYFEHLAGVNLIYSHADPVGTPLPSLAWPKNLFRSGRLRPFFVNPYLYFINNQIMLRIWLGEELSFKIDYSISFDTNAASYLEDFVKGNCANLPAGFVEALEFIIEHKLNFDYSFYLMENTPNYSDPIKAKRIRQKLIAILKFVYIDKDHYRQTGRVKTTKTDEQLEALADGKLHEFYVVRQAERGPFSYEHWHDILYVVLLKIIEIEYCRKGRVPIEHKIERFYEFMHEEMSAYFDRMTVIAIKLFESRSSLSFFNPINRGGSNRSREILRNTIRGMAWDLTLIRILEQLSAMKMGGDFYIPLFLSADRKLVDLFDKHPLKGSVAHGGEGQVVPLAKEDTTQLTSKIMGKEFIKKYFDEDVVKLRLMMGRTALDSAPRRLLHALENKVLDCLSSR